MTGKQANRPARLASSGINIAQSPLRAAFEAGVGRSAPTPKAYALALAGSQSVSLQTRCAGLSSRF